VQAAGYGPPPGYYQPDSSGGHHAPYEFISTSTPDISHSWASVHKEWDGGHMDGFYEADGANALGYYTAKELPFYYSLFRRLGRARYERRPEGLGKRNGFRPRHVQTGEGELRFRRSARRSRRSSRSCSR
jgi:hypothetical protein